MPEYSVSRGRHHCRLQDKQRGLPEPEYWSNVPPGGNFFKSCCRQKGGLDESAGRDTVRSEC
jgi:hypothetical protein